jgi:hypothetical protein
MVERDSVIHHTDPVRMRMNFAMVTALLVVIVSTGCKRESAQAGAEDAGTVVFSDAGVSLDIGPGWQRINMSPGPPVCTPTLVSGAGMIRAMLFAPDRSEVHTAASSLKTAFEANTEAVRDSFRQEDFTTPGGLQGVHLSYTTKSEKDGNVTQIQSHNYIVKNQATRCVSISYIVPLEKDSESVHQMIRKTLSLRD